MLIPPDAQMFLSMTNAALATGEWLLVYRAQCLHPGWCQV